jgi:AAA+ superfamily predicted ATPase
MYESPRDWLQGYLFFLCPTKAALLEVAERIVPLADIEDIDLLFGAELAESYQSYQREVSDVYEALLEHLRGMAQRGEVWARLSALAYRLEDPAIQVAYGEEMKAQEMAYPW